MNTRGPGKTLADYLVIAVSPVLVMVLVGSLSFFLIEVFYRGEAAGSVRWVMFWFVLAVVLVTRLGIERSSDRAAGYGIALAAATWLYLVRIHPAYFVGVLLLAVVWWCAHKLTRDCTLIDDDEDASGDGLLQIAWRRRSPAKINEPLFHGGKKRQIPVRGQKQKRPAKPHPPGLWLVYFSLAALPLFGFGQTLLPGGEEGARRWGFAFLFAYMMAALGLLLTTSFLGLRRYLRQRQLSMPGTLAFGWIKFGVAVAGFVLAAALLLPRPGVSYTWTALRYHLDHQLRRASEYAAHFSPDGEGHGRSGKEAGGQGRQDGGKTSDSNAAQDQPANDDQAAATHPGAANPKESSSPNQPAPSPGQAVQSPVDLAGRFHVFFKGLFLVLGAAALIWWLIRNRLLIIQVVQAFITAVRRFFLNLIAFRLMLRQKQDAPRLVESKRALFAAYENPFITGRDRSWLPEQLILYSFEALQVWAKERGVEPQPQQTAREFCSDLGGKFPEIEPELNRLAILYGHAAFGTRLPSNCEMEPVRRLWRHLATGGEAVI